MPNFSISPARLDLCLLDGFDSIKDARLCPSERTALSSFYLAAKGREWIECELLMSQYESHCSWYGVECTKANKTVKLNLTSNGLSGTLSKHIAILTSLSEFDLSDNDIKVRGLK